MIRASARELTRSTLLLVCAACAHEQGVSGKAPERPTRPPPHGDAIAKDRETLYAQHQAKIAAEKGSTQTADASESRIGAASSRTFHRSDCSAIKDVAREEQVRFVSQWQAVDAGYAPCELCRPMR